MYTFFITCLAVCIRTGFVCCQVFVSVRFRHIDVITQRRKKNKEILRETLQLPSDHSLTCGMVCICTEKRHCESMSLFRPIAWLQWICGCFSNHITNCVLFFLFRYANNVWYFAAFFFIGSVGDRHTKFPMLNYRRCIYSITSYIFLRFNK